MTRAEVLGGGVLGKNVQAPEREACCSLAEWILSRFLTPGD